MEGGHKITFETRNYLDEGVYAIVNFQFQLRNFMSSDWSLALGSWKGIGDAFHLYIHCHVGDLRREYV